MINNGYVSKKRDAKKIKRWMKVQKFYYQQVSTGKWGLNEKHFRSFINKEKNSNFYLYILNKFYWIF